MNHSPYPVVLDACVLYPNLLRDLLMWLGKSRLYQPKWSATIHEEWQRNLHQNRPDISREKLKHIEALMNKALPDALVTGFEPLISSVSLPDADDRHVVAAAIRGKAEVIVTFNLHDFPQNKIAEFDIEALHPDDFISDLLDLNQAQVLRAVRAQRTSLTSPPVSADDYLGALLRLGLPMTVKALEAYRFMI